MLFSKRAANLIADDHGSHCTEFEDVECEEAGSDDAACDMTPMVDVTFLLLIFFVVTASFQLQKAIGVPTASVEEASLTQIIPPETTELELRVDQAGSFRILAADWQSATPSKQTLITQLKQWRTEQAGESSLLVAVEQDARLQLLVDAMDAGTLAGFETLTVQSVEVFP